MIFSQTHSLTARPFLKVIKSYSGHVLHILRVDILKGPNASESKSQIFSRIYIFFLHYNKKCVKCTATLAALFAEKIAAESGAIFLLQFLR